MPAGARTLLHLLLLHQPSVVRQDFTLWQVERHLQCHQDGELEGDQLPPADAESLLQLLQRQKQDSNSASSLTFQSDFN